MEDFGHVTDHALSPTDEINGRDKLNFAKWILSSLTIVYLVSVGCFMANSNEGKAIFELTSHIIPPIVTLVLGYYFGKD